MINRNYRVDLALAGQRLDKVLAGVFEDYSRGQLQNWLASGNILVDGQQVKPNLKLSGGESVVLSAADESRTSAQPQDIALSVVHQDDDLILVDKPVGLVIHPAPGHPDGTLQNALMYHFPELESLPRSGIVHRLDKDTSGIMVVARNLAAHHSLVKQLQSRQMSREYLALVYGRAPDQGTIDQPIGRHRIDRKRMAVVDSGKTAVTHFRVIERTQGLSLLRVNLESGRTHQIRVHMTHENMPLVGDQTYGTRRGKKHVLNDRRFESVLAGFSRQALHARRLTLVHPGSGDSVSFLAPVAADMRELLSQLGFADGLD